MFDFIAILLFLETVLFTALLTYCGFESLRHDP